MNSKASTESRVLLAVLRPEETLQHKERLRYPPTTARARREDEKQERGCWTSEAYRANARMEHTFHHERPKGLCTPASFLQEEKTHPMVFHRHPNVSAHQDACHSPTCSTKYSLHLPVSYLSVEVWQATPPHPNQIRLPEVLPRELNASGGLQNKGRIR